MIRTVLIEDNELARGAIRAILEEDRPEVMVVEEADSVVTGIQAIQRFRPDLVLLDVELKDGTGFDLLEQLDVIDFRVIFVTAYSEHAIQAFKYSALDYVVKPVRSCELLQAVDRYAGIQKKEELQAKLATLIADQAGHRTHGKFVLKSAERMVVLNIADIVRCEAEANYTLFFMVGGQKLIESKTLGDVEKMLESHDFLRVHHGHLINLTHLKSYEKADGGYVVMNDHSIVPVSRRKRERLIQMLENL